MEKKFLDKATFERNKARKKAVDKKFKQRAKVNGGVSFGKCRSVAAREQYTVATTETRTQIFNECKGVRTKKRAKSHDSTGVERAITTKRFANSRITCVCKSVLY